MSQNLLTETRFDTLNLSPELLQGVEETGFSYCTPIQAESLSLLLNNRDVAGQAQTGTGKTAAFVIAIYHRLLTTPAHPKRHLNQPLALVLAPTRELAIQIHRDAEQIGRHTGLKLGLVYGGTGYEAQRQQLMAGVDILIGTPGRLIDYFKQQLFDLRTLQALVLDEADRMFDLGFIRDIRYLLRRCPPATERLSMLFSATLSLRVTELAYEHMNQPQLITVEAEQVTADRIEQCVYYPAMEEKIPLLLGLMGSLQPSRAIIFVNTKRAGEQVWGYLEGNGWRAGLLSGDVPQRKRQQLLQQFEQGQFPFLVATDVAARGLHIPAVTHVFNYDLPQDAEDYVHRIGRTARAGATGSAISFACEEYAFSLLDIQSYIGSSLTTVPLDPALLVTPEPPKQLERSDRIAPRRNRGGKGSSGGKGSGSGKRGASSKRRRRPSPPTS